IIGVADNRAETERRVHLRMERQRVLEMPQPPRLWAMIDEMALLRPPPPPQKNPPPRRKTVVVG
ncbi:Scr1 family TA system antitoxin-like transcriptional regulator, partial [Nocardia wallacei]|uniref:Scr1 family TA system antitoxin-like transcriptional regulator n=1 Tax=Nocardia wallacei TaxID=480035 RepID=UPI0024545744